MARFSGAIVSSNVIEETAHLANSVKKFALSGRNIAIYYDKSRKNDEQIRNLLAREDLLLLPRIADACNISDLVFDTKNLSGFTIEEAKG